MSLGLPHVWEFFFFSKSRNMPMAQPLSCSQPLTTAVLQTHAWAQTKCCCGFCVIICFYAKSSNSSQQSEILSICEDVSFVFHTTDLIYILYMQMLVYNDHKKCVQKNCPGFVNRCIFWCCTLRAWRNTIRLCSHLNRLKDRKKSRCVLHH